MLQQDRVDLRVAAFKPFCSFLHARMRRAGLILAKCFAVSKPMPVFAPVTMTDLPVRSALSTGGRRAHCSATNVAKVILPILKPKAAGLGGWGQGSAVSWGVQTQVLYKKRTQLAAS